MTDADVSYVMYNPVSHFFSLKCPSIAGLHSPAPFSRCLSNPAISIMYCGSPTYFLEYWLFKFFSEASLRIFDAVHVLSPSFPIQHRKVFYIPHWVDTSRYKPCKAKEDVFTVLFVGRHHWEKGWDTFLRMCYKLRGKGYDFNYMCTGPGVGIIKGVGFVSEPLLPSVYSGAHVLVYPARADSFGLSIIEALACGTPVITTPIPVHKNMKLPLLYAKTVKDFVKNVVVLYKKWKGSTGWYERICSTGRNEVMKYDSEVIFPKYEVMLKKVIVGAF